MSCRWPAAESLNCVRIRSVVAAGDVGPATAGRPVGGGQLGAVLVLGGGVGRSKGRLGSPGEVDLARVNAAGCEEVRRNCQAREDGSRGSRGRVIVGSGVLITAVVYGCADLDVVQVAGTQARSRCRPSCLRRPLCLPMP